MFCQYQSVKGTFVAFVSGEYRLFRKQIAGRWCDPRRSTRLPLCWRLINVLGIHRVNTVHILISCLIYGIYRGIHVDGVHIGAQIEVYVEHGNSRVVHNWRTIKIEQFLTFTCSKYRTDNFYWLLSFSRWFLDSPPEAMAKHRTTRSLYEEFVKC